MPRNGHRATRSAMAGRRARPPEFCRPRRLPMTSPTPRRADPPGQEAPPLLAARRDGVTQGGAESRLPELPAARSPVRVRGCSSGGGCAAGLVVTCCCCCPCGSLQYPWGHSGQARNAGPRHGLLTERLIDMFEALPCILAPAQTLLVGCAGARCLSLQGCWGPSPRLVAGFVC